MSLRLRILERSQRLRARVAFRLIGLRSRTMPDDIARILLYRPAFFGRPYLRLLRTVMRGRSEWTVGERELFAAFVSRRNACTFCTGIHSHVSTLASGRELTAADLDNWSSAAFSEPVTATLALLATLMGSQALTAEDVASTRHAGVSDQALSEALHVAFLFNVINRLADVFGAGYEGDAGRRRTAAALYREGYQVPGFFLR
ncbi:MAG: carboxymuconolactone decarboxylase family protein [Dehalococcoidia bacterium]